MSTARTGVTGRGLAIELRMSEHQDLRFWRKRQFWRFWRFWRRRESSR